MPAYLIDVNLPYRFSLWQKEDFVFVNDLEDKWTDSQVWHHALVNNLVIVSKDADFFDRAMVSKQHPKIIHVRIGNMLVKTFSEVMSKIWPQILLLEDQFQLIQVYTDKIVIIK